MLEHNNSEITKRPTDRIERPWLFSEYAENMACYLKTAFLDTGISEDEIKYVIKKLVEPKITDPKLTIVHHESPGNAELVETSLLKHTRSIQNGKIVLPFGSVYKPPQEEESFLKNQINGLKKNRSKSKKLMLKFKSEGNEDQASYYNADQNQQKIGMNSIPGAMGSAYSFISDIAGFNSVTSTGRYFIISSYANCERLIEGNFYFTDINTFINHCTILSRICPDKETILSALTTLNLPPVLPDEIVDFFKSNLKNYSSAVVPPTLYQWLSSLPSHKLNFIYYYNNLPHIFRNNPSFSKSYIADLFDNDDAPALTTDPAELYKVDEDLIIVVSTIYSDLLPFVNNKRVNIYDTVTLVPDIAIKLTDIAKNMQRKLDAIGPALDVFIGQRITIPNVLQHKNMYRRTVIASDTDSIIFTTKNWLNWYTGSFKINIDTYRINAFIVYILTKSNTQLMNLLSLHRGATNEDITGMAMKNEYFYPVMTLSTVKKHYAGLYTIQEGNILAKPSSDIKGGQFRGSKLCAYTLKYIRDFIDWVHNSITENGNISIYAIMDKIIKLELEIYESLLRGETRFLPIIPVRNEASYVDANISVYFNYLAWEYIFAKKYGSIQIPTKCYLLPIKKINSDEYIKYISTADPYIHDKMIEFTELHSKKNLTRIPLNPELTSIPEECVPLIRTRDIILDNVKPLYLYLKSINVWSGGSKRQVVLFSEIYGHIPINL